VDFMRTKLEFCIAMVVLMGFLVLADKALESVRFVPAPLPTKERVEAYANSQTVLKLFNVE